jgi:hypothetical protein
MILVGFACVPAVLLLYSPGAEGHRSPDLPFSLHADDFRKPYFALRHEVEREGVDV